MGRHDQTGFGSLAVFVAMRRALIARDHPHPQFGVASVDQGGRKRQWGCSRQTQFRGGYLRHALSDLQLQLC